MQLIITIVFIPIYEEIFYKGIIFGYLRKNFNIIVAIVVQDLVLGVMHLNLVQGIYTFILGIVLALIYMYSESILGNITVHIIFNLLGILIVPKLLIKIPSMSIVLLIIAIGFIIFSSIKMIEKYENRFKNKKKDIIKTKKVFRNLGSKVGLKRDFIGCVCGLEWDNWKLF